MMNAFVTGNLRIGADRLYTAPEDGGIGLIKLSSFITGLQAVWISRAAHSSKDNWRVQIRNHTFGNPFLTNNSLLQDVAPVLKNLGNSFSKFSEQFYNNQDNVRDSFILCNKMFKRSAVDNRILDPQFFNQNVPILDLERVGRLRVRDFLVPGTNNLKSLDELNDDTGINFNLVTYMRIGESLTLFFRNHNPTSNISTSLTTFLKGKKGESKKIRKILDSTPKKKTLNSLTVCKTFFRLIGCNTEQADVPKLYGVWNLNFLPNKIRDFIFKFTSNQLALNTRLSHYVLNVNRACFFCCRQGPLPAAEESFIHLFCHCNVTYRIHRWFLNKYFPGIVFSDIEVKELFMLGKLKNGKNFDFGLIFGYLIQYLIWDMKVQKRVLQPLTLDIDFSFLLSNLIRTNRKFNETINRVPGFIFVFNPD
jgi:hypothetical protein